MRIQKLKLMALHMIICAYAYQELRREERRNSVYGIFFQQQKDASVIRPVFSVQYGYGAS
jgi:hypothetical protein